MNNNNRLLIVGLAITVIAGAGGYAVSQLRMNHSATASPAVAPAASAPSASAGAVPQSVAEGEAATRRHIASGIKAGDVDPQVGRKVLYYQDPMAPGSKFDKPAKSPFMDMMLVPVYAEGGGDADHGKVTISPRVQQNLGLRTAAVTQGSLSTELAAVGNIAFNERDQVIVQSRAAGFVERLYVRATLDRVGKGQALVDLYVPDWIAAQEEFLSLKRMQGAELGALVDGARQRMRLAGMSEDLIRRVEASGRTQARVTVAAPVGGVVTELAVREGMTVMAGATLFRINGLDTVWANAEVPETQAALLRPGLRAVARTAAAPGEAYEGKVQALLPDVNAGTRTLKARVELANPGQRLAPGMFVSLQFMTARPEKILLVPSEAVIQTGRRTVVMLAEDNGRFRPAEVEAGTESGGQTEIRRGLQEGQRVVVSSQFLIDSEASLRGLEARLNQAAPAQAPASATGTAAVVQHSAKGKVEAIGKDALTLSHGPVESLKWPPMTMDFKRPASPLPAGLKPGDAITFEFSTGPDGAAQLTRVSPIAAGAAAAASGAAK
jgi:membrane fusion protein, copper/silver efflux system